MCVDGRPYGSWFLFCDDGFHRLFPDAAVPFGSHDGQIFTATQKRTTTPQEESWRDIYMGAIPRSFGSYIPLPHCCYPSVLPFHETPSAQPAQPLGLTGSLLPRAILSVVYPSGSLNPGLLFHFRFSLKKRFKHFAGTRQGSLRCFFYRPMRT